MLRIHFSKMHIKLGKFNLKSGNKVFSDEASASQRDAPIDLDDAFLGEIEDQLFEAEEELEESFEDNEDSGEPEVIDEVFMMAYCDFLNRLTNYQFIPQSSVQIISEEYLKNYLKANEVKNTVLRNSLLKNIPSISETQI